MDLTIDLLRKLCEEGRIKWTLHALKRTRERNIHSSEVIDCIHHGIIIEDYHDDTLFPSCLICASRNAPIHVVASSDGDFIYFITA